MITYFGKCLLVAAARKALHRVVFNREIVTFGALAALPEEIQKKRAAYVSLWRWPGPDPRCSHGFLRPEKPLALTVLEAACGCALHDSIFPRLMPHELDQVTIRIHLLGEMQRVQSITDTDPHGFGLYLQYRHHAAIFLPEVLTLAGWDLLEAVSQLCLKSGLPGDMWMVPCLELYKIEVSSFGESHPGGPEVVDFTTEELTH